MGALSDAVADDGDAAMLAELEGKLAKARSERDSKAQALKQAQAEINRLTAEVDAATRIEGVGVSGAPWSPGKRKKANRATAVLFLSDWHFDEVVNPREMVGSEDEPLNAYDRRIAGMRLKRCVEHSILLAEDLLKWEWDGITVLLGGDMVSGSIHDELKETNEGSSPIETVEEWIDPMASVLATLAGTFGRVHAVGVVGNHGRDTRKPRAKGRVRSNYDWLLYRQLVRCFSNDDRFSWHIPESADAYFKLYEHKHLLTHGDQARGGSGISGLLTPISLFEHRKRKRDAAAGLPASHTWLGHWHTFLPGLGWTINGSGKGTDEYAYDNNFGHEPPRQAFGVITPQHNVTAVLPVFVGDRKREGW